MKRIMVVLAALIIWSAIAFGQTTVTLQVTDAGSQTWNNGTYTAALSSNLANGPAVGANSLAAAFSGTLSATGGASLSMNAGTWTFKVCPTAGIFTAGVLGVSKVLCYSNSVAISGSTQTVTLAPPAISMTVPGPGFDTKAYADAEVTCGFVGCVYYNLTSQIIRVWNGTAFTDTGTSAYVLFATLPTCTSALTDTKRNISDSSTVTWGATATGTGTAGTTPAGIRCNGTNWTVYAK